MYLSTERTSQQQLRLAQQAQRNRQEIVKALSHGTGSRRDLVKWGVFTAGGGLALKNGLNPFVGNAHGEIPTGVPRSPLFGAAALDMPMPRCNPMKRKPVSELIYTRCKDEFPPGNGAHGKSAAPAGRPDGQVRRSPRLAVPDGQERRCQGVDPQAWPVARQRRLQQGRLCQKPDAGQRSEQPVDAHPAWTAHHLKEPDKVRTEGDLTTRQLYIRYPQVRIPNLRLGDEDVAVLISYLDTQGKAAEKAKGTVAGDGKRLPEPGRC